MSTQRHWGLVSLTDGSYPVNNAAECDFSTTSKVLFVLYVVHKGHYHDIATTLRPPTSLFIPYHMP